MAELSYPSWVYHPNEDVTRELKKRYDETKKQFYKKCEELNPNYYKLGLRERMAVKDKAAEILGFRR